MKENMSKIKILSLLGIAEGISYLLFAITMPMKYYMDMPGANKVVGMGHGILFIAYCLFVLVVARETKWGTKNTFWALLASLIPFGTFVADKKIFKVVSSETN